MLVGLVTLWLTGNNPVRNSRVSYRLCPKWSFCWVELLTLPQTLLPHWLRVVSGQRELRGREEQGLRRDWGPSFLWEAVSCWEHRSGPCTCEEAGKVSASEDARCSLSYHGNGVEHCIPNVGPSAWCPVKYLMHVHFTVAAIALTIFMVFLVLLWVANRWQCVA